MAGGVADWTGADVEEGLETIDENEEVVATEEVTGGRQRAR